MTTTARKIPLSMTRRRMSRRERGLTMMELLITVVILSLLMAGLSQLVVTNSQNATATGALARIADTGRAAIQILSADVRRAGYLGGYVDTLNATQSDTGTLSVPTYAVNCVAGTTDWALMVNQPLVGINAPDDASPIPYDCIADEWLRGDALTVRYTPTPPIDIAEMIATKPYLRVTVDQRKLFLGSGAAASDNQLDTTSTVRDYNIATHTYFVGSTGRSCQGKDIPALFRKVTDDAGLPQAEAQELLAGVEHLQLRYLVGNRYYEADDVPLAGAQWPTVDAVEISVLVRAECPEAGFDIDRTFSLGDVNYVPEDKDFRRQVFTTTTHLRN